MFTERHTFELEGELCKNAFETIYSVSLWESTKNKDVWLAIGGAGKRKMEEQNNNRSEGQKAKPLEEKTNKTLEQQTKNSNYLKLMTVKPSCKVSLLSETSETLVLSVEKIIKKLQLVLRKKK